MCRKRLTCNNSSTSADKHYRTHWWRGSARTLNVIGVGWQPFDKKLTFTHAVVSSFLHQVSAHCGKRLGQGPIKRMNSSSDLTIPSPKSRYPYRHTLSSKLPASFYAIHELGDVNTSAMTKIKRSDQLLHLNNCISSLILFFWSNLKD